MKIGVKLKEARKAAGMSQETLARRCGMSFNTYSRIERGVTGTTVATLERIALELGLEVVLEKKK